MTDIYRRLAARLDSLPHGFPATDDGVELAILRRIFSPEDAAMALKLKPLPETAATVARRLRLPVETVRSRLDAMAEKGQIYTLIQRGRRYYGLAPFIIGIWEFQLHWLDHEMAELFEAYAPTLLRELGGSGPALARVVPVNRRIDVAAQVLPYDDLRAALERCRSFRVADCLCRTERALLGDPCTHPLETCMSFSREENATRGCRVGGGRSRARRRSTFSSGSKRRGWSTAPTTSRSSRSSSATAAPAAVASCAG